MKLNQALVLGRTKAGSLEEVKNLNLWGQDITDVSILARMPGVEVLSLSVNRIPTLRDFQGCLQLQELYLRKNEVGTLAEIVHLKRLANLRILWLCDNPCAEDPRYRATVVSALPHLKKLDNLEITPEERGAAAGEALPLPELEAVLAERRGALGAGDGGPGPASAGEEEAAAVVEAAAPAHAVPESAAGLGNQSTSPNTLYAVIALLQDMDSDSLQLVKAEVDQRLAHG